MRMSMSGIVVAAGLCAGLPAARAAAYPSAFLEAFGTGGLSALTLGGGGLAGINGDVQNVAAGGGKIYFQEGVDIFSANPDLTDITLFHTNGAAATSIAVDVVPVPEPGGYLPAAWGVAALLYVRRRNRRTGSA